MKNSGATTTLFLALTLLTLLTPAVRASPLSQLGNQLNSTVAQLGLLANAGYNTQSFPQLIDLLSNLFGSMMIFSEPYLNSFISQILAQNANFLAQIEFLENKEAAGANLLFQALNSASATLGSAIANIGGLLFLYRNQINSQILGLNNSYTAAQTGLSGLSSSLPAMSSLTQTILNNLQMADSLVPAIESLVQNANMIYPDIESVQVDGSNYNPGNTPNCINFFDIAVISKLGSRMIVTAQTFPEGAPASPPLRSFLDTQFIEAASAPNFVVLEICTRDNSAIDPIAQPIVVKMLVY